MTPPLLFFTSICLEYCSIHPCWNSLSLASISSSEPTQDGYLSGKYRRNKPLPEGTRFSSTEDKFFAVDPERLFTIVDELSIIAEEHNTTIPQAALNYLLKKPGVVSLIMGMRVVSQLEENLKTMEWEMTDEEVSRLDKISEPLQDYPYYTWDPEQQMYIKH